MMIQLNHGREIFQFFKLFGFWNRLKVIDKAFMRASAVGGGQAVIGERRTIGWRSNFLFFSSK